MPTLDSYLFFTNQCAPAMRFYERTLGGKLEYLLTYAQSPEPQQCPADAGDLVMHASLRLGDRLLMASDVPPGMGPKAMAGFAVSLTYPAAQEARRIFDALSEGGSVTMPMQETFWSHSFGMLTDRFGTPWMINGGAKAV
jgi:PhnB protein